ncbi:MAG: hypothetical protein RLZZ367_205 [Bacteroidota bacterium]|jgi:hypothetical protein
MKEGWRFVAFLVIAFVAIGFTYTLVKLKVDSQKYSTHLAMIKSCGIADVYKVTLYNTDNNNYGKDVTDSVVIGKIISAICKAKPVHAYLQREEKVPKLCILHIITLSGFEFSIRVIKDGSRPVTISYSPEDIVLWEGEADDLSFLFSD